MRELPRDDFPPPYHAQGRETMLLVSLSQYGYFQLNTAYCSRIHKFNHSAPLVRAKISVKRIVYLVWERHR